MALAVEAAGAPREDREAFLEEFIVRRELAVNFVRFNPRYDRLDGLRARGRGRRSTAIGATSGRGVYSRAQLEAAETHDPLWNAAQRQMMETGWMHGYVRMYWAKKILEWSRVARGGDGAGDRAERPVRARRPRPERLRGHRVGDRRQARPGLGPGAADLRDGALHVAREHVAQVRQPAYIRQVD